MNFEFLKGLKGLGHVYENCSNAEKLARTMPIQSVFTSRKSAELLARFIYMAAHNQAMEELTFADILSDMTVRNYVHNRRVMDAFHYIRRTGNRAVHSDDQESPEEAVSILQDLHYVAGETACILGLIDTYPRFNTEIGTFPNAVFVDEQDIDKKAREMFLEYIEKYNGQLESEVYYNHRVDKLLSDFQEMTAPFVILPGIDDLGETIEFKSKPLLESTIKVIQEHFGYLGIQALKHIRDDSNDKRPLEYTAELTIYGENGYSTTNLVDFVRGIMVDLPEAEGFLIKSVYYGPSITPWSNNEIREQFSDTIDRIGQYEDFTYTLYRYLYNHGEGYCEKYEHGAWIDFEDEYSSAIVDKDFGCDWWSDQVEIDIHFEFEKHSGILKTLHEAVRKHLPKSEQEECENCWEDGYPYILIASVVWAPRKLRVIQDFLDEVNHILTPILSECKGESNGKWYMKKAPFAIAKCEWTDDGFKIIGTEL